MDLAMTRTTSSHETSSLLAWLCASALLALLGGATACGGGGGENGGDDPVADTGTDAMTDTSVDGSTPDSGTPDTGPPEDFQVSNFGLLPPRPASCGSPGKAQRFRFYFQNRNLEPLSPQDNVNGRPASPNAMVNAGVLDAERTRIATEQRCSSASDCPGDMKCGSSGLPTARRYCLRKTNVSFKPGTVEFDYNPGRSESDRQLVGLLLENTGSWQGNLPNPVALQYDEQGNTATGSDDDRATDPNFLYRDIFNTLGTYLPGTTDPANTKVGGWEFAGTARVNTRPLENTDPGDTDHFTNTLSAPEQWLEQELNQPRVIEPANVYQALLETMDGFALDKYSDHEKFLIAIVDGPNEVKDENATYQDVLDRAQELNVHLSIIHLDAPIDPSTMRDLPTYFRDEDSSGYPPTCSSDSDCLNFETCRNATIYADEPDGNVTQTDEQYCMPEYNENGRLGPNEQYADLACQTEGHYLRLRNPEQFTYYIQRLTFAFDGQYSIEAEVSAFGKQDLNDSYYNLSGAIKGLLGSAGVATLTDRGFNFLSPPVDTRMLLQRSQSSGGSN